MTDTIWPPNFAKSRGAKYLVLIQSLRAAVRTGELSQGQRLPPVRELSWQLGITPGTVARAYKLAAEEGLVDTAVGRGTFVTGARAVSDIPEPLINLTGVNMVNFRSAQVVNVGQSGAISAQLRALGAEGAHEYVTYPTEETDYAAREAVVDWIGEGRAGRIAADDIVLAMGAQNATIIALQAILHGPAPIILTDELAYPGVRHAAKLLRARLIGVEMDAEGLRPDRLEHLLREHGAQVLLTSAEAHSPTTTRTSLARRKEIIDIARRHQLQIIEDDCHCIWWEGRPAYRELCPELCWYISSLTKSVSSALRFGYIVPPQGQARLVRQVAQSSFYGIPQPMIDLGEALLRSGDAARIRAKVRSKINERVQEALNCLGSWDIAYHHDVSFFWLKLPQGWRGSSFARACERVGISLKAADEFALADGASPNAVRIGISVDIDHETYRAALVKMSDILAKPPSNAEI